MHERPPSPGKRAFRRWRLAALAAVLAVVAAWAAREEIRRRRRASWRDTLEVAVVLLSSTPGLDSAPWERGLSDLAARLQAERERYLGPGAAPFRFALVGPVAFEGRFPETPSGDGPVGRLLHAIAILRLTRELDSAAEIDARAFDVRAYVLSDPEGPAGAQAFAEGQAAFRGEVALVRASRGGDLCPALVALGHELLHTAGATDKYDAAGHARAPEGLAEPERQPPYPQRFAEWMVGEVATGPGGGRLPSSLDEVRVGPATAREIGWSGHAPRGEIR
ncbi:MAG TPA: hypothetical protein VMT17_07325 [Anaeromyxobacteraceae bacterium]|nr:hypothetical protein [Anaeromyxobacteraceae bacterium]